jgi:beta-lactamase class A
MKSSLLMVALATEAFAQEPAALQRELLTLLDSLSARSALHARHVPTGREIAIRADQPMNALSVIKVPILVLAYRDSEGSGETRLDLDRRYTIRPEDRSGSAARRRGSARDSSRACSRESSQTRGRPAR